MENMKTTENVLARELPACPVETTLTLISDKWKSVNLAGLDGWNKAIWRTEKIHRSCVESSHCPTPANGRKQPSK